MIGFGKPTFLREGVYNVNARWQVNSAGQPDSTKAGVYVGNVRKLIPRGFAGFATNLRVDGYLLVSRSESVNGFVSTDSFFVSEQYLTDVVPSDFKQSDLAGIQAEQSMWKATGEYGITASWGMGGFNLPDWMKGFPGLLLFAGTVYVATRKKK